MSENGSGPTTEADRRRAFHRELRSRHPGFLEALIADTRLVSRNRGRPLRGVSRRRILAEAARLCWESDAFAAQALYRARARLQAIGVPILPRILHRLSIMLSQVCIGDPVVIEPGIHIAHGPTVIDGITEIGAGTTIFPFVTIGLTPSGGLFGPKIRRNVLVGSGSRLLGDFEVGEGARIGANAVVLKDVPAHTTAAGIPARVVSDREGTEE